jgi:hypothetical protein
MRRLKPAAILAPPMDTEPLAFFENTLPERFQKGVEDLKAKTGPTAKAELDDVLGSRGAIRIVVDGAGERWLKVEGGTMTAHADKPDGYPVRMVFAFTAAAAKEALRLLEESGRMDDPKGPARFARTASARAEKLLQGHKIEFHVIVTDLPDDHADVMVKIGVGVEAPPEKPQFTARISYDDIEELREGEITPQQILGRLRLTGDASKAMALGMMLMQPPPPKK